MLMCDILKNVIVLAVDSGIERTGYAVVDNSTSEATLLKFGCIFTDKKLDSSERIKVLAESFDKIVKSHKPGIVVIEKLFFNSNQKTVIDVAQAQGVTMYIAAKYNCRVEFLTPLQIKEILTGYGRADKKQIEKMLKIILHITELPKPDDVTDAIACGLAFCTLYNFTSKIPKI